MYYFNKDRKHGRNNLSNPRKNKKRGDIRTNRAVYDLRFYVKYHHFQGHTKNTDLTGVFILSQNKKYQHHRGEAQHD